MKLMQLQTSIKADGDLSVSSATTVMVSAPVLVVAEVVDENVTVVIVEAGGGGGGGGVTAECGVQTPTPSLFRKRHL